MAPKKQSVTLQLPLEFLATLPAFTAKPKPKPKAEPKKVPPKKPDAYASSPAPEENQGRVNTGPKDLSTAGLTVNSVTQTLDRSGKPCRAWTRGNLQFKAFSGFKVTVKRWEAPRQMTKIKQEDVPSSPAMSEATETPVELEA